VAIRLLETVRQSSWTRCRSGWSATSEPAG